MSKAKETEKIRVLVKCPKCKGTGLRPFAFHTGYGTARDPESSLCPQCLGTGNIGYTERTQAEIDAAEHERAEA